MTSINEFWQVVGGRLGVAVEDKHTAALQDHEVVWVLAHDPADNRLWVLGADVFGYVYACSKDNLVDGLGPWFKRIDP